MAQALEPVRLNDGSQPRERAAGDAGDNLARGNPVSYGFGWFLDPLGGRARMWHSGTTSGFRTVIQRFPAEALTIIILCNRTDLNPTELAEKIAAIKAE